MKQTHRTNDVRVEVEETADSDVVVIITPDGSYSLPRATFDLIFRELPSADGVIVYSCGCPHKDDIEVEREWILITADEGLSLKQAGTRFLPGIPDNFDALASAAEQMVKEGIIARSPFY